MLIIKFVLIRRPTLRKRHPYFQTKLKPEGPKKSFLETQAPALSKRLDNPLPPRPPGSLSQSLDPAGTAVTSSTKLM